MAWIEPLDLRTLLVNTFAGDINIFIFISLIVITSLAAFFRMGKGLSMLMLVLFGLIMVSYTGTQYLFLIILIGGMALYFIFTRVTK